MIPPCSFHITPAQYAQALRQIRSYIQTTTEDVDARPRAHAIYALHPPNSFVHGTVLLFHGLASTPEIMRPTMVYFFEAGYNVYAPPGAGHAFNASRLPQTLLGHGVGRKARDIMLADTDLKEYFGEITRVAAMVAPHRETFRKVVEKIERRLQQELSVEEFKYVMHTLRLLSATQYTPGLEEEIKRCCESDHERYETHPLERLKEVAVLPGPVYVIGYSLGGLQAINLAARAIVEKVVLLAPFVGFGKDEEETGMRLSAFGGLDLFELPFPISTVSARHLTACAVAARMLWREEITRKMGKVPVFVVIAQLDDAVHVEEVVRYCHRLGNGVELFVYPKETGLDHGIHPGGGNPFAVSLLKEIFRFFTAGKVDRRWMLEVQGDAELPAMRADALEIKL